MAMPKGHKTIAIDTDMTGDIFGVAADLCEENQMDPLVISILRELSGADVVDIEDTTRYREYADSRTALIGHVQVGPKQLTIHARWPIGLPDRQPG